jgi:alpha-beta hydrolase superfamily lysophospholipase
MLAPFTARDGENLALYEWPLMGWVSERADDSAPAPRGVVLIVHGLGEHALRYDRLANQLMDWGFAVRAYDQRGHGQSGGARGVLPTDTALLDDLAEIVDDTRARFRNPLHGLENSPPIPLIVLGHSMGGLVASRFVALNMREVDGLVLSSPALDAGLNAFEKILLAVLPRFAPNLQVGNGLDANYISHDQSVVRDYFTDSWVHDKITPRLASFIAAAGPATVAAAAQWHTPTLLMYAGADRLVNSAGSRAFADNAAASTSVKPGTVTARCFGELYHELFNELEADLVFEALKSWLDAHF